MLCCIGTKLSTELRRAAKDLPASALISQSSEPGLENGIREHEITTVGVNGESERQTRKIK